MSLPERLTSWLTINRSCNLRCGWCYAKTMKFSDSDTMSLDTVRKSIEVIKGLPIKQVILIGGEPTIHPDFLKIVRMVKEAGLNVWLITNSIKFADKQFLQDTIDAGVDAITTSLKAPNDMQYKEFTGVGAFSTVMKALQNLNESGIKHKISITVCDSLFKNFDEMLDVIKSSGVEMFSLDMERPIIVNNDTQSAGGATPREIADFFTGIYPKIENCGIKFTVKVSVPFCLFPEGFIEKLVERNQLLSACQIFKGNGLIIDPDGRVLPCNHFCNNPLGQIGSDFSSAEEYWEFRKKPAVSEFYKIISSCPHEKCVDCKHWKYCGSGCKVHWLYYDSEKLIG